MCPLIVCGWRTTSQKKVSMWPTKKCTEYLYFDKRKPYRSWCSAPGLWFGDIRYCWKYQRLRINSQYFWNPLISLHYLNGFSSGRGRFPGLKKVRQGKWGKKVSVRSDSQPADIFRVLRKLWWMRVISLTEGFPFWKSELCGSFVEKLDYTFIPRRPLQILTTMSEWTALWRWRMNCLMKMT